MKKTFAYLLVLGMLALPRIQANVGETPRESFLEKKVKTEKQIDLSKPDTTIFKEYIQSIKAPKYRLKSENCAGYARRAAQKLFKKEYSYGDDWDMVYRNKIISEVKDSTDIYKLINQKNLKPGMIIGFKNPHSNHKNKKDEKRKKVTYTHVALYIGVNKNFEPEFIHQEEKTIKKSTLRQMYKSDYKPIVVLDSNN